MIIAAHHQNDPWRPRKDWPKDTRVQWGKSGLVFSKKGNYLTAFFEAFPPKDLKASSFIRGEGVSLEEAEEKAFAQFEQDISCDHVIGRRGYTNGGGKCVHCDAFFSRSFHAIVELGAWREPLSMLQLEIVRNGYLISAAKDRKKHSRIIWLKARAAGIDVPPTPVLDGVDQRRDLDIARDYEGACKAAVTDYLLRNIDRLEDILWSREASSGITGFFEQSERRWLLQDLLKAPGLTEEQRTKIEVLLATRQAA